MKRTFSLIIPLALSLIAASSCGTSGKAAGIPAEDETVNIGYGTEKRSRVNSSISKVSGGNPETYPDIYAYLRGKVPGLIIRSDKTITIRGISSTTNSQPLILVDGVPTSDISVIEPSTVKSVEVLKDAGATGIYGVQGGNGVILITLKK